MADMMKTKPFKRMAQRVTETQILFPALALVVSAVLWMGTVLLIRIDTQATRDNALAMTRELTETYEAQVLRVLREIEQNFKIIQYAFDQQPRDQILAELSVRELLPPTLLFNIAILGPGGRPLPGSATLAYPVDEDTLATHAQSDNLIIDAPAAATSSSEYLQFRRRLSNQQGDFVGVTVIEADAAFFTSSYDESRMGENGMLALIGTEGQVKVRRLGQQVIAGEPMNYGEFMEGLASDMETVSLLRRSPLDGELRYISARALFGFPLAVAVGLSEAEQHSPMQARADTYIARAALINLLLLLVIGLLWRLSAQLAHSRRLEVENKIAHAEQIEYLAYHDGLTGLPNRSLFSKLLCQNIAQGVRANTQLALMFLDLDHFKYINDTLGHDAGDDLLKEVSQRLRDALRESDIVARLGGDEFVVILPVVKTAEECLTVARKIIQTVAKPYQLAGQNFSVTASIGISMFPEDGRDEETLTKHADIAMYKAKQEGKNTFQLYSSNLHAESIERLALESNLRQALERDQFALMFQVKQNLKRDGISGVQAVLRWQHPHMGLVTPSRFLKAAEEMGLLVPIGRWMLNQACRLHQQWLAASGQTLCIAVELWRPMFYASHLLADIQSALKDAGLPPECLEVEISESVLMEDIDKSIKILSNLKALGVRIALGNFGVGYSCMGNLRSLPVDVIKLDRSFVSNLSPDNEDRERAEAICTLGKSLGMTLIADGVETDSQMQYLKANSTRCLEGFYRNSPMTAEAFSNLIQSLERQAS